MEIPTKQNYYMLIAGAVSARSNCVGRTVGAVLVRGDRIVSTGYNGVAQGMTNCLDGGCTRCADRKQFASGTAYDLCVCVHAESNAITTAARYGIAIDDAVLYSTDQPCFSCSKELIQAGIQKVWYKEQWQPDERVIDDYGKLQKALKSEQLVTG